MIIEHACYKDVLKNSLESRKKNLSKIYSFQNLAKACRVQKTYLSKVFRQDAHLNDDQVFLAATFLGFTESETEYVRLLLAHERSVVPAKRKIIENRLRDLKKLFLKTNKHLNVETIDAIKVDLSRYYLDIRLQLVHMALTIEPLRKKTQELAHALSLDHSEVISLLRELEELGLIWFNGDSYEPRQESLHLDSASPLFPAYRSLMRLKAIQKLDQLPRDECYNFSVLFSANPQVYTEIRQRFLEFLSGIQSLVQNAKPTEVYQMSFDLFPWTKKSSSEMKIL